MKRSVKIIGLVLIGAGVLTQTVIRPMTTGLPVEGRVSATTILGGDTPGSYFHWMVEDWTGDDQPFLEIRNSMDAQVKNGTSPQSLAWRSRLAAQLQAKDAPAQYRRAYSALLAYKDRWRTGQNDREVIEGVMEAMEGAKQPHCYEYSRLRLIMLKLTTNDGSSRYVQKAMFRLLKRNPDDDDLKYIWAFNMPYHSNPQPTQDLAYEWAKDYLAKYPQEPKAHYLMGRVLRNRFDRFKTLTTMNEAHSHLNKAKSMLPDDHHYHRVIDELMKFDLQAVESFREKKKLKP